jgi:O-antigen/teichoic acid export membrane protein
MFYRFLGSFSSKFIVALINLFVLLITSRYLGPGTRGEIGLWLLDIFIIQMIAEVLTGYSLVHFIPHSNFKKIYQTGIYFSFFVLILFFILFFYKRNFFEWDFYLLTFLVIINSFHFVFFLGYGHLKYFNYLSILQPALLLVGILFMLFVLNVKTFHAWRVPMLISFMITGCVTGYFLFKRTQKDKILTEFFPIHKILKNGILSQSANLCFVLSNRYNFWNMEKLGDVGIYSTATALSESLMIFSTAMAPIILSDTSLGKQHKIILKQNIFIFILVVLLILLICIIPESFIIKIIGNGFLGIKKIIVLLSIGVIFNSQTSIFHHFFSGKGNLWPAFISNFSGFLFTMGLSEKFFNYFGIIGFTFVANISYFIIFLITLFIFFFQYFKIR